MALKPFDHTIEDTGIKLKMQKVSPTLIQSARLALLSTKPDPPLGPPIEMEGPLKGTREEMPDDPKYQEQLAKWLRGVNSKLIEMQVERAVLEIEYSDWETEAADLRKFLEKMGSDELPDSDKTLFITHIACGTDEDLKALADAIQKRSQPTDETVSDAQATFRPEVQRARRGRNKAS